MVLDRKMWLIRTIPIKTADWIIDLGPDGGPAGGLVLATGTPEEVAKVKKSETGRYLKQILPVKKPSRKTAKAA